MEDGTTYSFGKLNLKIADGYRVPTPEEWDIAKAKSRRYIHPIPPIQARARMGAELMSELSEHGVMEVRRVVKGNIAILPKLRDLYRIENTLRAWSSSLTEPQYVIAPKTSDPS